MPMLETRASDGERMPNELIARCGLWSNHLCLAGGNKSDEFRDELVGGVGADKQETVEPGSRELPPGPRHFRFTGGMV